MAVESLSPNSGAKSSIRMEQALAPSYLVGSFTHDTANHDFVVSGGGKHKLTVMMASTGTSTYTTNIYGSPSTSATVGGVGVASIVNGSLTSTATTVLNSSSGVFPYYLVRLQSTDTGSAGVTTTVYLNMAP